MKTAVLLTGISAATFLLSYSVNAQYTAAGATATVSAAGTVSQSQKAPPPVRDARFSAAYGSAAADRQARAKQPRRAQQAPPGVVVPQPTGRATQLASPAAQAQKPAAPARDPRFSAAYGSAAGDRQARSQAGRAAQPPGVQQQRGAVAVPVVQVQPRRAPDPGREERIINFQRQKAISGNPGSQYDLGMRYLKGNGVEQDRKQAMTWLKLSANGGYSRAKKQVNLLTNQAPAPKPLAK